MIIRDMFESDINRKIQGVIQVGQDVSDVIEQELNEYVITKESIKSKSINTPFLETKCFGALKYHVLDGKVTKI